MRFTAVVLLALMLSLSPPPAPAADTNDAQTNLGNNAAMKYWAGFALLPTLDHDQEHLLESWNKVPLDVTAQSLIQRSALSRQYLHRGTSLPRCDWSLDYDDGIRLLLPHLGKSLTLARLTALHARQEFEQGHWQSGWDDVSDLLILARHVEVTPIMIANLVGYRIESIAIDVAAPWLSELNTALPARAFDLLETLPERPTLTQLVTTETQMGPVWMMGELKQVEQQMPGRWRTVWKEILVGSSEESDPSLREFAESVKTLDQALQKLEAHIAMNQQLEKLTSLPWKEFDLRYGEFVTQLKSENPQGGFLLPNLHKGAAAQRRAITHMALFTAARLVVVGGADKVKTTSDPFADGPFEYRALPNGFELKSKFEFKESPLSLTVGRPPRRR